MTTQVENFYQDALLSAAAYADLFRSIETISNPDLLQTLIAATW